MSKPVAFITGGSRGIGFGCAHQLAQLGFDVAINGMRDASAVSDAIARNAGANVLYCQGDIGSAEARASMLASIKERFDGSMSW